MVILIIAGSSIDPENRPLLIAASKGLCVKYETKESPELYYMFRFNTTTEIFAMGVRYQVLRSELNPQEKYPEMFPGFKIDDNNNPL